MTVFSKTIKVNAFHFILADPIDLAELGGSEGYVQSHRIQRELPKFFIYDVTSHVEIKADVFDETEPSIILSVVQLQYDDFEERSNITHILRPEEWLIEDFEAEGGYRVVDGLGLHAYLNS